MVTRDEGRSLETETPEATRDASEESRAPDPQSSTSAEYALVASDVKRALELVSDASIPIGQRAITYAGLRVLKLAIDRAIREPGRELQSVLATLAAEHGDDRVQYGPLRLKWSAIDVRWPVNEPGNWQDAAVQEWLEHWSAIVNRDADEPIVVVVPEHYEVDTKALGAALTLAPSQMIRAFYAELKEKRLRTEAGRRASIEVVD